MSERALVYITHPPRYAGVIVCLDHLAQLDDVQQSPDHRHAEITSADATFHGDRCLMCGVIAVPDRSCENPRCRRPLHAQWPSLYCCNDCALEDI